MGCEYHPLPGGGHAIVCSRGNRARVKACQSCKAPATLLCDHPDGRGGTCDNRICESCAVTVGPDRHHCPAHDQGTLL